MSTIAIALLCSWCWDHQRSTMTTAARPIRSSTYARLRDAQFPAARHADSPAGAPSLEWQ